MASGKGDLVFFGTSEVCIPFLESLKESFNLKLIITQPDSFGGRKKKLIKPAVKIFAETEHIDFIQPEKLNTSIGDVIKKIDPVIGVVISYGKFIPKKIFEIPSFNIVNVHFSLLPLLRGSAPVQRAIEAGDNITGITFFEIERSMDSGPIWWQKKFKILPDEKSDELIERLSREGSVLLPEVIKKIINGKIRKSPQKEENVTFANIIKKEEGRINWNLSSAKLYNRFRAFYPWPGLFFFIGNKKIDITETIHKELSHTSRPGTVMDLNKNRMLVSCDEKSVLEIYKIKPAGKKAMTPYTYSLGNKIPDVLD